MESFRNRPLFPVKRASDENDARNPIVPVGLWEKCPQCQTIIYSKSLGKAKVCPHCNYHYRITADERLSLIIDEGTFYEWNTVMPVQNPLDFPDYDEKLQDAKWRTGLDEAVVTGTAAIDRQKGRFVRDGFQFHHGKRRQSSRREDHAGIRTCDRRTVADHRLHSFRWS